MAAERAGFDSGWVTDHVVVPPEHAPIYGTIAEALVSLGFLAGRTERLQLGVSALVVPQRNPLVALKQLTTLDFLSGGRIITAVAAGWMEGEFVLLADFASRGRQLDDWVRTAQQAFEQCPARSTSRPKAGSRRRSSGPVAPSSGSPASRTQRSGARADGRVASRRACRRTSCAQWPPSSGTGARTAAWSSASASTRPAGGRRGRTWSPRRHRAGRVDRRAPGRVPRRRLRRLRRQSRP